MIRVADYVVRRLVQAGVRDTFLVTGGGAMHLNDAFGRCKDMRYLACHHEQACAMAAESYYRLSNRLAAVNVTSGPGGTNAITGVYGAWTDSIGMVVISGQVKWETAVRSTDLPLRQLGDQELDITRLIGPITKYAVMVTDPASIRYHLERALHLATSGRPGPVWLDIPMNVQGALVDDSALPGYDPTEDRLVFSTGDLTAVCRQVIERLGRARRPVILAGSGVRLSRSHERFIELVDRLGIPVATAWNSHDVLWDEHPCYVGRPGTVGDRPGNFAVQNADLLMILGCRCNLRQVSYGWKSFAREAHKVMVDIDEAEMRKPTLAIDLPIHADLGEFIRTLLASEPPEPSPDHRAYLKWCRERRAKYPVVLAEYRRLEAPINPYCFVETLFECLGEGDRVVTGDGTACVASFQAARPRKNQRLYTNSGCAPMGYDLPAAIGACVAADRERVVCLAGDGSIQMNLQELQTIVTHRLPIKIFVLNNGGYHSIRQTQQTYFSDNPVGYDPASGIEFPSFERIAWAYGIPYRRVGRHSDLTTLIREALEGDGPQMCEVVLDPEQPFSPKLSSRRLPDGRMVSSPLEDLSPFLDRRELEENLLVAPWEA